jgi:hypothetical protein
MKLNLFKILIVYIILAFFLLAFSSCSTSTSIFSWRENTGNENKFRKILVLVLIKDLEYRAEFEKSITSKLNKYGIYAVKSLDLMSPVERYSKDNFDTLLQKNNFDGLLTLKYEGSVEEKSKRDGIKYYQYYRKFFKPIRRKGYIISHKTVIMESVLFSTLNDNYVWAATTKTKDSSDAEDLANSVSDEIINDLQNKKIIK